MFAVFLVPKNVSREKLMGARVVLRRLYIGFICVVCAFVCSRCPSREEFPLIETEYKAHLRRLKGEETNVNHTNQKNIFAF